MSGVRAYVWRIPSRSRFHALAVPIRMKTRLTAALVGAATAALASQTPEFVQQYRQRLGGAIDELGTIVGDFDSDARALRLTREDALTRLHQSAEPVAVRRADRMREAAARLAALRDQQVEMAGAGSFGRIVVFFTGMDTTLAARTAGDFEPAVPLTLEGAVTAGAGFLAGYGGTGLAGGAIRRRRRKMQQQSD